MKINTKKKLKKLIIGVIIIAGVFYLSKIAYTFLLDTYRNINACEGVKIDRKKYKVYGIDVSAHQNKIVWEKVAKDNIVFTFIKATEGKGFVMRNVDINQLDLPPVLDVERHGSFFAYTKVEEIRVEIQSFLDEIQRLYSVRPIIYTNVDGYNRYIEGNFPNYEIWICRICIEPHNEYWSFWQYSHKGRVWGIETEVDLNTFNGTKEDFENYINRFKARL